MFERGEHRRRLPEAMFENQFLGAGEKLRGGQLDAAGIASALRLLRDGGQRHGGQRERQRQATGAHRPISCR